MKPKSVIISPLVMLGVPSEAAIIGYSNNGKYMGLGLIIRALSSPWSEEEKKMMASVLPLSERN